MAIPYRIFQAHGVEGAATDPPYHLVGQLLTESSLRQGWWICDELLPRIEAFQRGEVSALEPVSTELLYLEFTKDSVKISEADTETPYSTNIVPLNEFAETLRMWRDRQQKR
jgi:hypothetical protein